ncbi:MAG: response regulator transcription factor [Clostridia bacterium]|nr:response regulator transcription factor [Clostridia bacterium]
MSALTKISVAICDDEKFQLSNTEKALKTYFENKGIPYDVKTFGNPVDFIDSLNKNNYAIALLDICMPGITGIDVAKEIRRFGSECCIIFLTTSREFALDAYEVDALQYLVKPYTQKAFDDAMDKAFRNMGKVEDYIIKKVDGVMRRIAVNTILFAESDKHYVNIYLDNGDVCRLRTTVDDLADELDKFNCFKQSHKSYLINLNHVVSFSGDSVSVGTEVLPVSKSKYAEFKEAYVAFAFSKE